VAKNTRYKAGDDIDIAVAVGTVSGDPVVVGGIAGYANIDRQDDGTASVRLKGSALFTVKAANASGNSPIAVGDAIYIDPALTPKLSKIPTAPAVLFGHALTALASGLTGEVEVLLAR
jgi:predicted RecA/RadA family phage recombinase